jgi:hypothetical protein
MGSDHLPISFALPCRAQKKKRGRGKCSFKKARWSDFKKDLESVHLASPPPEDARPGVLYAWIRDTILASAKKNIPFGARRGPNKPFWNDACEAARLDCNRARKHAERTKSGPAINGYNRARRKATHTIAEEQIIPEEEEETRPMPGDGVARNHHSEACGAEIELTRASITAVPSDISSLCVSVSMFCDSCICRGVTHWSGSNPDRIRSSDTCWL